MRICVYAISKNEEQFVDRFCEAAKDADLILLGDTGSTDDTVSKMGNHLNTKCISISINPWRFDHARNAVLAQIPADYDVCVSLDLDEILQPGWRAEIEKVWEVGKTTRLEYMFDWGCGIAFWYEKIHSRKGYFWHHPVHEYPTPDMRTVEVRAKTPRDFLMVIHKPDSTKSRGQYLDLLKMSVTEDPFCPRNAFYYARELSFVRNWAESIKECDRYLALPRANWCNERCYAYRVKGRCYTELGKFKEAEMSFFLAASEAPYTREPWSELAMLCYSQKRWGECFAFAMRGLEIKDREQVYTVDPEVWGLKLHDLASLAAHELGMKDVAREQLLVAIEKATPGSWDHTRLTDNLQWMNPKPEPGKLVFTKG